MAVSHENPPGADTPQLGANARDALGHRTDLDATLPPTPVRELLAASGATLFVLATDAVFLTAIRRAAGDRYPLVVVESWADLKQAADSGRCGIALLDAALLGPRVTECIAMLAVHADRLVTLVAADRASAQQYVGLLSGGRVHRLLIKPAAVGATRLLIESATARRLQLREAAANDEAARSSGGVDSFPQVGLGRRRRRVHSRIARRRACGEPTGLVGPFRRSGGGCCPCSRRACARAGARGAVAR